MALPKKKRPSLSKSAPKADKEPIKEPPASEPNEEVEKDVLPVESLDEETKDTGTDGLEEKDLEKAEVQKEEAQGSQIENSSDTNDPKSYQPATDAVTVRSGGGIKKLFFFFILIGFFLGLLIGGVYFYYVQGDGVNILPKEEPVVPTSTPTLSPTPTIALTEFSVQVLNGSGVTGAAGAVQELLEENGFSDVAVGNAPSSNFTETEVAVKEDVPEEVVEEIIKILADYEVTDGILEEDDEYDIIITVGQTQGGSTEEEDDE